MDLEEFVETVVLVDLKVVDILVILEDLEDLEHLGLEEADKLEALEDLKDLEHLGLEEVDNLEGLEDLMELDASVEIVDLEILVEKVRIVMVVWEPIVVVRQKYLEPVVEEIQMVVAMVVEILVV